MMIGLPVVVVMLPLTWLLLTRLLFPAHTIKVGDAGALEAGRDPGDGADGSRRPYCSRFYF